MYLNNNLNVALGRAVSEGSLEKVKVLLSAGADVNFRVVRNYDTLLHITKSVEITKELLLRGAAVDEWNMFGETPLFLAVTLEKELEIVRELLKHGADVNAADRSGITALNYAVKFAENLEVVKTLLEYGADATRRNWRLRFSGNPNSPLDNAVLKRADSACAELLIKLTLIRNFNNHYGKIIDLAPYKGHRMYNELLSYVEDCVCEVLQMKTEEVKVGRPLYEFVTNNSNMHELCNQLSKRFAKIDYTARYPIYNDVILDKIKTVSERDDLLNKLSKIQFYTIVYQEVKGKKIVLDHDSTYKITEYLSNDSLLNFITAFEDSNKRPIPSSNSLDLVVEPGTSLYETSTINDAKRARLE